VHVGVSDFVTEEVLLSRCVFEDERLISSDDLSKFFLRVTNSGMNFPYSGVHLLVDHTNFLVSREPSESIGRNLA
jgi:hypothetical protein